ncbi:MAG: hypothetical protein LBI36_06175 [Oscillospiraceae bacterium]|jgi:hypothetical protein|nr:hypothetical protein [Oscillospiraceae bacterium]
MENNVRILNLKFGTWENQLWFTGTEENSDEAWNFALTCLDEIGDNCSGANEFFVKVTEFLEERGFYRMEK